MRHSASPRSMSTRRNVKRPAWSAERRLQRATSRTGPSVSAAPLTMCCILGSHGTFVYPSPPVPLSAWRRGGTKGEIVPPLHNVERGPGGEVISSETARLVQARGARPAVAPHARSVPRARVRVHAATDAGEPRGGVLPAVSGTLPRSRHAGAGAGALGARGVGWAGILRTCFQSPRAGARGQARPRGHVAR